MKNLFENIYEFNDEDPLLPGTTLRVKANTLIIAKWNKVSSLEWPIIITVFNNNIKFVKNEQNSYANYQAVSRATTKLIDITLSYKYTYEHGKFNLWTPEDAYLLIELYKKRLSPPNNYTKQAFTFTNEEKCNWQELCNEFNNSNIDSQRDIGEIQIEIANSRRAAKDYARSFEEFQANGGLKPAKPPSWIFKMFEIMYEIGADKKPQLRLHIPIESFAKKPKNKTKSLKSLEAIVFKAESPNPKIKLAAIQQLKELLSRDRNSLSNEELLGVLPILVHCLNAFDK